MSAEPLRVLEGGSAPRSWEKLWARDAWGQTELPHGDLASMYRGEFIRFERIVQLWQREDGLAGLPAGGVIHARELPRVDHALPKTLPAGVFAQWIDPANLALLDERDRTIVLVLAFTGFRVSSVVTLMRDCLELGSDSHPYMRYVNVKASREAMLRSPSLLAEQLQRQQAFLAERFPETEWLFPSRLRRGAKRGAFHIDPGTVNLVVERYVLRAEIRTAEGKLALDIYPHLFRHNVGTSMVNDNKARKNNSVRLIEVLERDEDGLSRILEGLDAIEADHASSEELDLRELAAPDRTEGR